MVLRGGRVGWGGGVGSGCGEGLKSLKSVWSVISIAVGSHHHLLPNNIIIHLQNLAFIIRNKNSLIYIDIMSVSDVNSKKYHRLCALR